MIDVANSLADTPFRLGFQSLTELNTGQQWVSETELYQWADEAAKLIAYKSGVFLTFDTSITAVPGTPVYELPATHIYTIAAWLGYSALRMTPVRELQALDGFWPATAGPAVRASLDANGVGTITLYPNPTVGGQLAQVCQEYPATVEAGQSQLSLSSVCQDYFTYRMLAGARGKESDARMADMADHFEKRCQLYEAIIAHLWGAAQ